MAAGWQIGAQCFPAADMAASHACSAAYGMTSAGLLSCSSFTVAGNTATLQMSSGAEAVVALQPCDRMTYTDTWLPLFTLLVLGSLAIWGLRQLIDMFKTDGGQNV